MTATDPSYARQRAIVGVVGIGAFLGLIFGGFYVGMLLGAGIALPVGFVLVHYISKWR